MGSRNLLNKNRIRPSEVADFNLEEVNQPLNEAASIDDRIVSVPEPDEHMPETARKKGIVSVNGEDVDSAGSKKEKAA